MGTWTHFITCLHHQEHHFSLDNHILPRIQQQWCASTWWNRKWCWRMYSMNIMYKRSVDVPRLTEIHVAYCFLYITLTIGIKLHYSPENNCTWCSWGPSWPLYWIVTVSLMIDTSQLNKKYNQVMGTKCAKPPMQFCTV